MRIRFDPSTEAVIVTAVEPIVSHGLVTPAGHRTWHSVTPPRMGDDLSEGDHWVSIDAQYPKYEVEFDPLNQMASVVARP